MKEELDRVESFYDSQLSNFIERFHILVLQAIELKLIDSYDPYTKGFSTQLQRELERKKRGIFSFGYEYEYDEKQLPNLCKINEGDTYADIVKSLTSRTRAPTIEEIIHDKESIEKVWF